VSSSTSSSKGFVLAFVTVTLLGSVLFALGSEYIVRTKAIPRSNYEPFREKFHEMERPYVAFADSRGANGLRDTELLANFSYPGNNLETLIQMSGFIIRKTKPRGVILQADPHHFANYRMVSHQGPLLEDLFSTTDPLIQSLRPVYRQYLTGYWTSTIRELLEGDAETAPSEVNHVSTEDRLRKATIRAQLQVPISGFSSSELAGSYRDAVTRLAASGLEVCLLTFPVNNHYRETVSTEPLVGESLRFYDQLSEQTGTKRVSMWDRVDDTYFRDSDHLNEAGALLLTDQALSMCFGIAQ
jgi:hypothetical protein